MEREKLEVGIKMEQQKAAIGESLEQALAKFRSEAHTYSEEELDSLENTVAHLEEQLKAPRLP
ncbi:MAG: hypothetical protein A2934_04660 [Candidatus Sungbacteria bacterium RIFCSPLOWO2_01_FULL_47_10]|uniref:Uncharacterized protein n=1 Tax=Candidatus Sungbacteria bacterium RIFCSPLOWO2_01_FULL_47_10 TaxID=1802276 RepID=A0A1G2L0S7_9BACT|nr:MAG: hypothetical protein A2934_04660 [Candidatus Sungbacteria bacterium RIFCSPLOWO2_01_FULL_47_10]